MSEPITLLIVPPFSALCNLAFALRREVFVIEQNIPEEEELDTYDLTATHLVAIASGNFVGTLRLIEQAQHTKIGRVVVAAAWRGQGIARQMMSHAMELARTRGATRFHLAAQQDKTRFYEQFGFVAYGEPFDDGSGILHLNMKTY